MADDYYSILGVDREAPPQDIKKAFRLIARECHPDIAGEDPSAEARFKLAKQAYETLIDPVMRARYDRRGDRRVRGGGSFFDAFYNRTGAPPGGGPEPGRRRKRGRDPGNDLDLDDLFSDFADFGFGNSNRARASAGGGGRSEPRNAPRPEPGEDVSIVLDVPLNVARDGGTVTAVYYRMQRSDSWRPGSADPGVVRIQDIADVRIIPGTQDGEILRERGLGDAGPYGGPYGDLVSRVRVVGVEEERARSAPPPRTDAGRGSEAQGGIGLGDDGTVVLAISVVEALLGGRVELETPQGRVRLTIPAGTSGGTRLRLKQKGAAEPGEVPADLYVQLRVVVPKTLDAESRRLIEQFAALNPGSPRDD